MTLVTSNAASKTTTTKTLTAARNRSFKIAQNLNFRQTASDSLPDQNC